MKHKTAQLIQHVQNIFGTFEATSSGNRMSSYPLILSFTSGKMLLGLAIAVVRGLKMKAANPNALTMSPLIKPLRCGNHSQAHTMGGQNVNPTHIEKKPA